MTSEKLPVSICLIPPSQTWTSTSQHFEGVVVPYHNNQFMQMN